VADSTTVRAWQTLASNLDSVRKLEQTAESWARQAGFDEDEVSKIAMSVREAAVNAVHQANRYDEELKVRGTFEMTPGALTIRVADEGPGLNPNALPDPLAPENILRSSGRGIFLMRAFMDEVHFRELHPGTEITLIKSRKAV
jgi:serine/threonine-protein kinase RsbW